MSGNPLSIKSGGPSNLAIWAALIVRAALASGCRVLYTEDLQHGRTFDGLEIVDPFANDRP